ncbi:hypothetical protein [Piscinibacter sp.]|uniref:hypothetical protein n=1 Tax=Piscinibacter sp. TaxID=1903157 RepID=UPI0039E3D245
MRAWAAAAWLALLAPAAAAAATAVEPRTVCTITVNSPDEKESFRRHLGTEKYRFVELVERGRPDWLDSSCRAGVFCDILVISAHYDGGNEFFPDSLDAREFLPVSELERVSCSGSCPSLFARLQEVYLFGCNTLNPAPHSGATAEVVRSLVREGLSRERAERELNALAAAHGESSRDRMRQVFKGVPVIYGFASTAPLGHIAGGVLDRYFRQSGERDLARGRPSRALLNTFSNFGMTAVSGMTAADPYWQSRQDMCQFADERRAVAAKLAFVHGLLQRHVGETRLYLDRIRRLRESLDASVRHDPMAAEVLEAIARDEGARERVLAYARRADRPETRVAMFDLARDAGWLTAAQRDDELMAMLAELYTRPELGVSEIHLACQLNADGHLDGRFADGTGGAGGAAPWPAAGGTAQAAMRACLGSAADRAETLQALLSPREADVELAQAYLRHHPVEDAPELRRLADDIAAMAPGAAQVRALEALGRHYVSDREVLETLVALFGRTSSAEVQTAVAGILLRADRSALDAPELRRTLTSLRRDAGREGTIDALIALLGVS